MIPGHEQVRALLGVWVSGECSEEEARVVADHVVECRECADVVRPPEGLRGQVLAGALGRRPAAVKVPGYAASYAAQVSVLDAFLAEFDEADWRSTVIFDWNVQDVLAHLAATDGLLLEQVRGTGEDSDVASRTEALITSQRGRDPGGTRAMWRRQADELCGLLSGAGTGQVRFFGQSMRLSSAVVARAFETWVHSDDIGRAVGRGMPAPLPRHLHAMADLGVRSLPAALMLAGERVDPARVVLTGAGGGVWTLSEEAPPVVTVELDVLEFCFLAADRRGPDEVSARIDGDDRYGRRVLEVASAFAGP
jgi:uncharacterized protein (TIGR03083 family)